MKRVSQTTGNAMAHSPAPAGDLPSVADAGLYRPTTRPPIDFRPFYSSLTARLIPARIRPGGSVVGGASANVVNTCLVLLKI
jgi:hypothetical protein